jgi:hypothetical protein
MDPLNEVGGGRDVLHVIYLLATLCGGSCLSRCEFQTSGGTANLI